MRASLWGQPINVARKTHIRKATHQARQTWATLKLAFHVTHDVSVFQSPRVARRQRAPPAAARSRDVTLAHRSRTLAPRGTHAASSSSDEYRYLERRQSRSFSYFEPSRRLSSSGKFELA